MNTNKILNKVYKNMTWIVLVVSIIGYFAYRTLEFEGSIEQAFMNPSTWFNVFFVVWLNLSVQTGAFNTAISLGTESPEFELADEINNKIIKSVNNHQKTFREYVKRLNYNEKISMEEEYLYSCGVESVDELTRKQLRKFKKLRPIKHDIEGFNRPLFYETTRYGNVKYEASFDRNKGIARKRIGKILSGIAFGALSINIAFNVNNFGEALASVIVISTGLIITYLITFMPTVFQLKFVIPKGVIQKNTLFTGFIEYQNGKVVLKEIPTEREQEKVVEKEKIIDDPIKENNEQEIKKEGE